MSITRDEYSATYGGWTTSGRLQRERYYDDSGLALFIGQERLSVNLTVPYGLTPPAEHFYAKDYSGCEGLPAALVSAGIAEHVSDVVFGPFDTKASLMRLRPEVFGVDEGEAEHGKEQTH